MDGDAEACVGPGQLRAGRRRPPGRGPPPARPARTPRRGTAATAPWTGRAGPRPTLSVSPSSRRSSQRGRAALLPPPRQRSSSAYSPARPSCKGASAVRVACVCEPQGPLELRGGLAMRAERRGAPGRLRRVPQDGLRVAGALGVVGQQRRIGIAARLERGQQAGVQFGLAVRGDSGRHGHPHQLVPESQADPVRDEDPGRQAVLHRATRSRPGSAAAAPGRPGADDRRRLHRPPGGRRGPGQPGAHHVAHRRRHRRPAGVQDLAHVERVAAGHAVQFLGIDLRSARPGSGPPPPSSGGSRIRRVARCVARSPSTSAERVIVAELIVAVGDQHQGRHPAQPPPGEAQQVRRRLVGPVDVLDHRHGEVRGRAELGQEGGEQPVPRRPVAAGSAAAHRRAARRCRTAGRAAAGSAARRRRPTASGRPFSCCWKRLEERGLAHAGLAGHQDEAPVAASGLGRVFAQCPQKRCPLKQFHLPRNPQKVSPARIVPCPGRPGKPDTGSSPWNGPAGRRVHRVRGDPGHRRWSMARLADVIAVNGDQAAAGTLMRRAIRGPRWTSRESPSGDDAVAPMVGRTGPGLASRLARPPGGREAAAAWLARFGLAEAFGTIGAAAGRGRCIR